MIFSFSSNIVGRQKARAASSTRAFKRVKRPHRAIIELVIITLTKRAVVASIIVP